ncbi:MAG: LapA family protein [Pseudomonadota bacterium]
MKYIKYLFLGSVGLILIVLALANRQIVTLRLFPGELDGVSPVSGSVALPLFVVIFLGVFIGLFIGFVWEWFREFSIRRQLSKTQKDLHNAERELKVLRAKTGEGADDVLALVD